MNAEYLIERPKESTDTLEVPSVNGKSQMMSVYYTARNEALKWSSRISLPQIGDLIRITMNGIGPATVTGYFSQEGYVGVMARALNPPLWLREQRADETNNRERFSQKPQWYQNGIRCYFGAEIDMA